MKFKTEQEDFWAGSFGTEYISRNQGASLLASDIHFFAKSLTRACKIRSCIEFGANVGMNLEALKLLHPSIDAHAIEINDEAARQLACIIPASNVYHCSILDFSESRHWDLVLIKGVLIHINPQFLHKVYDKLFNACGRYLMIAEYYNPTPVNVPYRGHKDRLFKRDFAGEIMDRYPSLELIDYGFIYHRDQNFPQDDVTWFLMEKH